MTDEPTIRAAFDALALRAAIVTRLEPPGGEAVLRSIVESVVALFASEASSIAIHDPARDVLVFRHAAGPAGKGAIGLEIPSDAGIAGYVFTTAQPLAVSDVTTDPRFARAAAESSGYVPRQILALPLTDDDGTIGVLEIIDRTDGRPFDLRDIELATVFARQATIAIRASRVSRDAAELIRATLARLATQPGEAAAMEPLVAEVVAAIDADADDALWRLVEAVARVRSAAPGQVGLVADILDALARNARSRPGVANDGRGR